MPTTPTLPSIRGLPSSPHNLPPPRQMARSSRLPPPVPSSRTFDAADDDDPFSIRGGGDGRTAYRGYGESSSGMNERLRRLQAQRAPDMELPGLESSDEDDQPIARMSAMRHPGLARGEHDGPVITAADRAGPDPASFFYGRRRQEETGMRMEVEESTLDPVEAAQIQAAMEEATEEEPEVDEVDEGDTEEAEVDGDTADEGAMDLDNQFDPTGLKEIGNLASWTVSTCKPGSGVEALRNDDTNLFWQSDGPQPHHLNIHFSRLVNILSIRIYLDFEADESYTPTKLLFLAGTGYHDLIPFAQLKFDEPKGWIDVDLSNVGGGQHGNELRCFLVQLRVVENHQNGKDTHVRGLKIYAKDERQGHKEGLRLNDRLSMGGENQELEERIKREGNGGHLLEEPDWMGEPELR